MKIHEFPGKAITITYDPQRCIHAQECVHGLSAVFDPQRRPWIVPDAGEPRTIAETILRCPTGALHFQAQEPELDEKPAQENLIRISPSGPFYFRGRIEIAAGDTRAAFSDTRAALCRCGASQNKPLCDGTHSKITFSDAGLATPAAEDEGTATATEDRDVMTVTPRLNGPLHVEGQLKIENAQGDVIFRGNDAWLCRCGGSKTKPFCDGTHKSIAFRSGEGEGFPPSRAMK